MRNVITAIWAVVMSTVLIFVFYNLGVKTTPPIYTPKFQYGQCFGKSGLREPWESEVLGKVYQRGYQKYIVMYKSEADRRHAGAKDGWEEDILDFDKKHKIVPCPGAWQRK